jgi:uncharacterized surface protein with fasciclin (FAS1) repeats
VFQHDEFFQQSENVAVSETFACKRILFKTIGSSSVKVGNTSIYEIHTVLLSPYIKHYAKYIL